MEENLIQDDEVAESGSIPTYFSRPAINLEILTIVEAMRVDLFLAVTCFVST